MSMSTYIPDSFAGPNFNKKLLILLRSAGIDSIIVHSILQRPIVGGMWSIQLPDVPEEKWKQPNFRLVLHAQDFVNWYKNTSCPELLWIEKHYTLEQQRKIIFLHWEHSLNDCYTGLIKCVEFPSHSYELVHQLKERWDEWKDVHNKDIGYNFICLNGQPKPHRNKLHDILRDEPTGYTTHGYRQPAPFAPYIDYNWNNTNNFINLMPLYQQAKSSIVSETIYSDSPGIITEKTLLAIAAKHPFMCIGHINIHREIAERGFENFDNLFDLSYDTLDEEHRLDAAIDLNLPMLQDPNWDTSAAIDKTERNFDFLMNDYTKSIEQRAQKQIYKIMAESFD